VSSTVDDLLRRLSDEARGLAVPLLEAAPLVERLVGIRPHRSALHRWASKGTAGVRLEVLRVGGTRCVTPRMLAEFFVAAGAAREPAPAKKRARPRASGRAPKNNATAKTASPGGSHA
jgi:hypothetical protein